MDFTNRKQLLGAAGALALVIGGGGVILGRTVFAPEEEAAAPVAAPAAEGQAKEGGEAGHGPEGFVALDQAKLTAAGIQTETVAAGSLGAEVIAQATVEPSPQGAASLAARADGAVTRILKRLGDPVRAGEAVAYLESREAAGFAAERAAANARATAARAAYNREIRLFNAKVTARQDLEAAQAALAQAEAEARRTRTAASAAGISGDGRFLIVTSPISGRVTAISSQLGAFVSAGTELFRIANPSQIQINAAVPAVDAGRISIGDRAMIELPGGGTVAATVRSATPSLDAETRTATVVLNPVGTPPGLQPGQSLRVRILPRAAQGGGSIVVPEEAIQSVEGRDVVFVRNAKGFQAQPVTVGGRSGGRAEILDGLTPGAVIAARGAFVLKSQLGASEEEH